MKYLQLLLILFISACIPTENVSERSCNNLSFLVLEKCLAPQSFSFHQLTSEMLEKKWKTASDHTLINLIKNKNWTFLGKGQSSLVFQAQGIPFILKIPFTVGNVNMEVKETFNSNALLRFLTHYINNKSEKSFFFIRLKRWAKALIVNLAQKSTEGNETPLLRGYSLWRRAFTKEIDPCPNRALTLDTRKLKFDLSTASSIDLNMSAITSAHQNIIIQQKVDLKKSELESLLWGLNDSEDLDYIKELFNNLFAFQNKLFLEKGIMDVDLWFMGNYAFNDESGVFSIDPGAFRDTQESFGEIAPFLSRNIERAEKILTGKKLSKSDKKSDLYRVTLKLDKITSKHGKKAADYFLEQLIEHYQRWQHSILGKPFVVTKEKEAVENAA